MYSFNLMYLNIILTIKMNFMLAHKAHTCFAKVDIGQQHNYLVSARTREVYLYDISRIKSVLRQNVFFGEFRFLVF